MSKNNTHSPTCTCGDLVYCETCKAKEELMNAEKEDYMTTDSDPHQELCECGKCLEGLPAITKKEVNEEVYDLNEPHISIHYCKFCKRFFNGDFGCGFLGICDNCSKED